MCIIKLEHVAKLLENEIPSHTLHVDAPNVDGNTK